MFCPPLTTALGEFLSFPTVSLTICKMGIIMSYRKCPMEPTNPQPLPKGELLCSQPLSLVRSYPPWQLPGGGKAQACRSSCHTVAEVPGERLALALLYSPRMIDPLPFLLTIPLLPVNLRGTLSTATNIKPKLKHYPVWLLWELKERLYTFSIIRVGTKQVIKVLLPHHIKKKNEQILSQSFYTCTCLCLWNHICTWYCLELLCTD